MKKYIIIFLLFGIGLPQETSITSKANDSDNKFIAVFDLKNTGWNDRVSSIKIIQK